MDVASILHEQPHSRDRWQRLRQLPEYEIAVEQEDQEHYDWDQCCKQRIESQGVYPVWCARLHPAVVAVDRIDEGSGEKQRAAQKGNHESPQRFVSHFPAKADALWVLGVVIHLDLTGGRIPRLAPLD